MLALGEAVLQILRFPVIIIPVCSIIIHLDDSFFRRASGPNLGIFKKGRPFP